MPGVGGRITAPSFNVARDRDWRILLDEIDEGEVVPIIGQDALTEVIDGQVRDASRELALDFARELEMAELAQESGLHWDADTSSAATVLDTYVRWGGPESHAYDVLEDLVKNDDRPPPQPLHRLATITPLRLFVTTNFDDSLERALVAAGRKTVTTKAYKPTDEASDLENDFENRRDAVVYHLLGKPGDGRFAVTDADILEFMHQLLSPVSARRPEKLFDALEKRHLLFIGCRFPDWLTRFFLRMARGMPLGDPHGLRNWIAGGTVEGEAGAGLQEFLGTSQRTKIFKDHTASTFIDELHRRWWERHPNGVDEEEAAPEPEARERIFLSYASEDVDRVRAICDELDKKHVLYWFDKHELKGGDNWDEKIRRNVDSCCLFVPFLTKSTLTSADRYFRDEWKGALKRQDRFPPNVTFMLPVQLDEEVTKASEAIWSDLRKLQWTGREEFLDSIVSLYRQKQRELVDGKEVE